MPEARSRRSRRDRERLRENIRRAVKVRDEVLEQLLVALIAEGHVLIEDHPGVGKTALARALARSIDAEYARVQCTVDLLPADVVGTNVFNQREARFEFHPGPVFANVVLVDEINRASPKTQSGLLECMQERRVTVDGQAHELARPFLVIATQNPVEYEGTYPLPEAQLDRFMVQRSARLPERRPTRRRCSPSTPPRDRVLDLEPVADVDDGARRPGRRRRGPRQRGAAPLRGRARRGDPHRPARRARRQPARRRCCCSGPRRRGRRSTVATTRCPTTSRRSRRSVLGHRLLLAPGVGDSTSARRWSRDAVEPNRAL